MSVCEDSEADDSLKPWIFMKKAQIFMFDVIIAVTAFIVMALAITSISRQGESQARQETYSFCLSVLEALKANGTMASVGNETTPESALNLSLSQLPKRFGYQLNLTTYSLSGSQLNTYSGTSGNVSDAERYKSIIAVQSTFVTANATPLLGEARLRCWVRT
jgi:hypothetical protein